MSMKQHWLWFHTNHVSQKEVVNYGGAKSLTTPKTENLFVSELFAIYYQTKMGHLPARSVTFNAGLIY